MVPWLLELRPAARAKVLGRVVLVGRETQEGQADLQSPEVREDRVERRPHLGLLAKVLVLDAPAWELEGWAWVLEAKVLVLAGLAWELEGLSWGLEELSLEGLSWGQLPFPVPSQQQRKVPLTPPQLQARWYLLVVKSHLPPNYQVALRNRNQELRWRCCNQLWYLTLGTTDCLLPCSSRRAWT